MGDLGETVLAREPVPDAETPYLALWGDRAEQRCWPLRGRVVTIGRALAADVVVEADLTVSRVHTTLELVAGTWTVTDDGLSRNGTYLNGRRVAGRAPLHDRDEIRVGSVLLIFCAPAEAAGPPTLIGSPLLAADRLTPSQRAVLLALCRPYGDGRPFASPASNQQIADELYLSVDAVKTHLRAVFHRLGLEHLPQNAKRTHLAELALRCGLVSTREL